jgi:HSP20 family molecular chaperone IbpA
MTSQELPVQQKRELEQKQEGTVPARSFIPNADIYETDEALIVLLEMPGVDKSHIDISVEDDVLTVEGRIDFSKYHGLTPIYAEYPVGHYRRGFTLSNRIDQHKISAETSGGVLTITLPKVEEVKPRRISIG